MKLNEIAASSFVVDMMMREMAKGKDVWVDIDGDMATAPLYGKIERITIIDGGLGVRIELEGQDPYDMNADFNPAVSTFDDKYTLDRRKGQLTLVKIKQHEGA